MLGLGRLDRLFIFDFIRGLFVRHIKPLPDSHPRRCQYNKVYSGRIGPSTRAYAIRQFLQGLSHAICCGFRRNHEVSIQRLDRTRNAVTHRDQVELISRRTDDRKLFRSSWRKQRDELWTALAQNRLALFGQIDKALIIHNPAVGVAAQCGQPSDKVASGMHPGDVQEAGILRPIRQVGDQFFDSFTATLRQPPTRPRFRGCRLANANGAPALTFRSVRNTV